MECLSNYYEHASVAYFILFYFIYLIIYLLIPFQILVVSQDFYL